MVAVLKEHAARVVSNDKWNWGSKGSLVAILRQLGHCNAIIL